MIGLLKNIIINIGSDILFETGIFSQLIILAKNDNKFRVNIRKYRNNKNKKNIYHHRNKQYYVN